jgi:glucose/arabinose dehydrogenase
MPVISSPLTSACKFCIFALTLLLAGCGGDGGGSTGGKLDSGSGLHLEQINHSLNFPLFATAPADGSARLFVVEKNGVIKILDLTTQQILPTPFLNLTGQIATGEEQGLLGLAFHPNFNLNGLFYVNVINLSGDTEIRRYQVSLADPNVADPTTMLLILSIDQPAGLTNHKGGWLGFGQNGLLYVALGDGGGSGDPSNNAQNPNSLLGKILRLNVDMDAFPTDAGRYYAIPAGNPFAGAIPGADEIWAYGLRNPWRPSFDRVTGDFYIADVGQDAWEEVNVATSVSGGGNGVNYGWKIMEGNHCFFPSSGCNMSGLARPVVEYDHTEGRSITGGYVYRGGVIPALQGTYFYADYSAGFVRSFRLAGGMATEPTDWMALRPGENITSFGQDEAGELYIITQQGGLYRIVPD